MMRADAVRRLPRVRVSARDLVSASVLELMLFATVFTVSFTKFYLEPFGKVTFASLLAIAYVALYALTRLGRSGSLVPRGAVILICFAAALTLVYAAGYSNIASAAGRSQFFKAWLTWVAHGLFMACCALHLAREGMPLIRRVVIVLITGFCVNAGYGILQLVAFSGAGINIDRYLVGPLPFSGDGSGGILNYGGGIYRINGLTRDPNHLGVILAAPCALAATWLHGRARTISLAVLIGGLALSLSRSGLVGAFAALVVLLWPWRARLLSRTSLIISSAAAAVIAITLAALQFVRPDLMQSLIIARLDPAQGSAQIHVRLYGLVGDFLSDAPWFGNGLNSFSLLFSHVNGGRTDFGPHSLFIQLLVETGLLGATVFIAMIGWLMIRCIHIADIRAWGVAAAIVGTIAGNVFYLTTQMMYDELLFALAAALPVRMGIEYNRTSRAHRSASMGASIAPDSPGDDMQSSTSDIDLQTVANRLRRNWWVIALAAVIGISLGIGRTIIAPTTYTAQALVYLGQPVSPNGGILTTVTSRAATALDIAQGADAVRNAASAAGVPARRVRDGLVVTTAQSPLASKLASAPMMMRITVTDRDGRVATVAADSISRHLIASTNTYVRDKQATAKRQIRSLEESITQLERQRTTALARVASTSGTEQATWALLASNTGRDLTESRSQLDEVQSATALTKEIELSRMLDEPVATRNAQRPLAPAAFMWGLIGLLAGCAGALIIGRRADQSS